MKKFSKRLIGVQILFAAFILACIICWLYLLTFMEEDALDIEHFVVFSISISALLVLISIYCIAYYHLSGYEINDHQVICHRGVFFRKHTVIDRNNIHAINIRQGLFQRILGVSSLLIDSGSANTSHQAEIVIHEDKDIIKKLYNALKYEEEIVLENERSTYNYSTDTMIYHALIDTITPFILLVLILAAISFFQEGWLIMMQAIVFAIVVVAFFIVRLIMLVCQYHAFSVKRTLESLEINYGLFVKTNNSFKLNKIKAIKIIQGPLKALFGYAQIRIEVIGYGSTDNKFSGVLIPLCKKKDIEAILNELIPDYLPLKRNSKSCFFKPFIILPFGIFSLVSIIVLLTFLAFSVTLNDYTYFIIFSYCLLAVFLLASILWLIDSYLSYKNQSLNVGDDLITAYSGGLLKIITIVKNKDLVAIEDVTTYFRKKKGIYDFKIHFHSNAMTNVILLKCLSLEDKTVLLSKLKF